MFLLVQQQISRLVFPRNFNRRVSSERGIALHDHWLAACKLYPFDEATLNLSQVQWNINLKKRFRVVEIRFQST